MKKTIIAFCIALLAMAPLGLAVDQEKGITPNGVSQGTVVAILKAHETLLNELAADHDADNATVEELVADHDADNDILNGYETLLEEVAADHDADNDEVDIIVTLLTELKADMDSNNDEVDKAVTLQTEVIADHDADNDIIDAHETLLEELGADHDADNGVIDDIITLANGLRTYLNDGLLAIGTLAVTAPTHQYKTTTTVIYTISGVAYAKVAEDTLTFSAADTINVTPNAGDFWGAWLIQTTGAGVISTKSVGADQNYASEAEAIAALPAADALNVAIGYITVEANNGASWTANTDDLVAASDCQAVSFVDSTVKTVPSAVSSAPAADLAASFALDTVAADLTAPVMAAFAADIAAATPTGFAADLAAGTTVSTVAADLTATASAADLAADSVVGSGTTSDPSVSLTD